MRYATTIINDAICDGGLSQQEGDFDEAVEVYGAEIDRDRADAYAFALALAVLTWLHGSQPGEPTMLDYIIAARDEMAKADQLAPVRHLAIPRWDLDGLSPYFDARAELDAWMQAGIAVTGAKGDDGRVRVRPTEEGGRVIGYTFVDEIADFKPLTPEESAILDAQTGPAFVRPFLSGGAHSVRFPTPKAKP